MEFDSDWLTLGRHRVRLRSTRGFPTDLMRSVAEVVQLAIDNNMSARARLVETVFQHEQTYDIAVGTTLTEDRVCAPQLEAAIAVVLGLLPNQVNIIVTTVSQEEVDLHFGVYERAGRETGRGAANPVIFGRLRLAAGAASTKQVRGYTLNRQETGD